MRNQFSRSVGVRAPRMSGWPETGPRGGSCMSRDIDTRRVWAGIPALSLAVSRAV